MPTNQELADGLPERGRLYILEPGTREASRNLRAKRRSDEFHIVGPSHMISLPNARGRKDRCHFTWRVEAGEWAQKIAEAANEYQELHFFLAGHKNRRPTKPHRFA